MESPALSLVIPCYNEQNNIPVLFNACNKCFSQAGVDVEYVFVNDGSQDKTPRVLRQLVTFARGRNFTVQAINFSRNFGKEAALYAGLKAARGKAVCLIDADMQQSPEDALYMYGLLLENPDYDCVAACQVNRKEGSVLKLFKRAFYRTFNGIADDITLPADVSDFRVFRREVADALLDMPEYDRFSKGLFAWVGFKTLQVPYEPAPRADGKTKWSFRRLFKYAMNGIFSFTTWPLKVGMGIGIVAAVVAAIWLIVTLCEYLFVGIDVPGYPTLACLILLFGGLQLVVLSLLGEYVGRSYIEGKHRPIYIARERLDSREVEHVQGFKKKAPAGSTAAAAAGRHAAR